MSVLEVTKNNFQEEVINSKKVVLVDFFADWCGPCKMLSPIVDEIAKENDSIKVCKINVDNESELAAQFGVMSIPTLVVVKDGIVAQTSVGLKSKDDILEMVGI